MSALTTLGPLLVGSRTGRAFWVSYVTTLTPSYFFVYGFVYMAGRMGEERAATSRARKEAELANVHLREYATQVEELAVLRERNRLAREVHDTVAHGFTGIIMQMEAVSRMLTKSPAKAESALRLIQEQARESLAEVRRSVHALRPLQMEKRKGVAALRRLVEEFSSTTGMDADILVEGAPVELPAGHDLCLYRTVQEGLTNAFRHGRADQARVRLRFAVDHVVAAVEDNGRPAAKPHEPGLGIIGVRERAEVLGGIVAAGPGRAGGFVLQLTLPLAQPGGVGIA
jgi:signal transduction histidine kinase